MPNREKSRPSAISGDCDWLPDKSNLAQILLRPGKKSGIICDDPTANRSSTSKDRKQDSLLIASIQIDDKGALLICRG